MGRETGRATGAAVAVEELDLVGLVAELRELREGKDSVRHRRRVRELPSRAALKDIADALAAALFPTHYGSDVLTDHSIDYFVGETLRRSLDALREQVRRGLLFLPDEPEPPADATAARAAAIVAAFAAELPAIRRALVGDINAAFAGDPSAANLSEVLLCYPGMTAVIRHRFAHALHRLGVPFVPRLIASIAHAETGIDIHPGARIGPRFFVDHGTGVVIGETAIIGENVRLYQAVTLGAKSFPANEDGSLAKGLARHPIIEDDVVIYAGATILGRITVGRGSTVGGNVWLTHDVPPGSHVTQARNRWDGAEAASRPNENGEKER